MNYHNYRTRKLNSKNYDSQLVLYLTQPLQKAILEAAGQSIVLSLNTPTTTDRKLSLHVIGVYRPVFEPSANYSVHCM